MGWHCGYGFREVWGWVFGFWGFGVFWLWVLECFYILWGGNDG